MKEEVYDSGNEEEKNPELPDNNQESENNQN